jgi:hypothetical protein
MPATISPRASRTGQKLLNCTGQFQISSTFRSQYRMLERTKAGRLALLLVNNAGIKPWTSPVEGNAHRVAKQPLHPVTGCGRVSMIEAVNRIFAGNRQLV